MNYKYNKEKDVKAVIMAYEKLVGGIERKAHSKDMSRAYGGIVRAGKGKMVEAMAREIVKMAWQDSGQDINRLEIVRKKTKIQIKKEYVEKIKNPDVRQYILENIDNYFFSLGVDLHVFIDKKFVLAIECKAYAENAMLKRILVDFTLFKQVYPNLCFILFQLESQLGGDYSNLNNVSFGSPSTHTLLSYFDIDLDIITLLKGERKVDQPIHKKAYYKPLTEKAVLDAIDAVARILARALSQK